MSKTLFRSRNIESERPIPIFHFDELSDLNEYTAVSRSITQMPTGMEKEEESEHHLKVAMEAQALYGGTQNLVIPVPEVTRIELFNYPPNRRFVVPLTYIKQCLDYQEAQQKYDLDSEDENWINEKKNDFEKYLDKLEFEKCIDKLEWIKKYQAQELTTSSNINDIINQPKKTSELIFSYWNQKRQNIKPNYSLVPEVRTEQGDGGKSHDPYVAFRKRFEKMQTRKNRKYEESLFEKLLRSHINLVRLQRLVKPTVERERDKLLYQHLIKRLFFIRCSLKDRNNIMMNKSLSLYQSQLQTDSPKTCSFIGAGVIEYECILSWKSSWRVKNMFNSNKNTKPIIDNFLAFSRFRSNSTAIRPGVNKTKSPSSKTIAMINRNPQGLFYRSRMNRVGQIIRDSVTLLQPVEIIVNFRNEKQLSLQNGHLAKSDEIICDVKEETLENVVSLEQLEITGETFIKFPDQNPDTKLSTAPHPSNIFSSNGVYVENTVISNTSSPILNQVFGETYLT